MEKGTRPSTLKHSATETLESAVQYRGIQVLLLLSWVLFLFPGIWLRKLFALFLFLFIYIRLFGPEFTLSIRTRTWNCRTAINLAILLNQGGVHPKNVAIICCWRNGRYLQIFFKRFHADKGWQRACTVKSVANHGKCVFCVVMCHAWWQTLLRRLSILFGCVQERRTAINLSSLQLT